MRLLPHDLSSFILVWLSCFSIKTTLLCFLALCWVCFVFLLFVFALAFAFVVYRSNFYFTTYLFGICKQLSLLIISCCCYCCCAAWPGHRFLYFSPARCCWVKSSRNLKENINNRPGNIDKQDSPACSNAIRKFFNKFWNRKFLKTCRPQLSW